MNSFFWNSPFCCSWIYYSLLKYVKEWIYIGFQISLLWCFLSVVFLVAVVYVYLYMAVYIFLLRFLTALLFTCSLWSESFSSLWLILQKWFTCISENDIFSVVNEIEKQTKLNKEDEANKQPVVRKLWPTI